MPKSDKQNMEKSNEYWQKKADDFDAQYKKDSLNIRSITRRFLDKRTDIIHNLITPAKGDKLLDVGCGSGVHMVMFARDVDQIVGLDYSADMLKLAEMRLKSAGISNYKFFHSNAESLPFDEKSFDCVISIGLLDYVESPKVVIAEFHRILKTNGWIVLTIPKKPSLFFFLRSKYGIFIREKIFKLPPIITAVFRNDIENLLTSLSFKIEYIDSLWTTMWIIKVRKL